MSSAPRFGGTNLAVTLTPEVLYSPYAMNVLDSERNIQQGRKL